MVTKKITKPAPRTTRPTAVGASRPRAHSLAPAHVGETGGAALLGIAILGLAIFIGSVAVIVSGLTMGSRYAVSPPPNLADLGRGQVLGGIALLVLGIALVASAVATFAEVRGSRLVTAVLSLLTAVLAAAGVVIVMSQGSGSAVLAGALAVAFLIFGAAGVILLRPRA